MQLTSKFTLGFVVIFSVAHPARVTAMAKPKNVNDFMNRWCIENMTLVRLTAHGRFQPTGGCYSEAPMGKVHYLRSAWLNNCDSVQPCWTVGLGGIRRALIAHTAWQKARRNALLPLGNDALLASIKK